MRAHEIDYKILGDDMQVVEITLDNGETIIAEAGAMNWMDEGIRYESKLGDGSQTEGGLAGKLFQSAKRAMTGESLFLTHFTNNSVKRQTVAFAAPYPGKIIPINLNEVNNSITCQKDAYLCSAFGTKIDITFTKRLGTGFFGGEGFILQKITGDGMVFLHAGGTVVTKQLNNEKLLVDTGCLVGFTSGIDYNIEMVGSMKSMLFGGEGIFLATLTGTGTVMLQSLPFSRLADRIIKHAPVAGGSRKGEGSILGGLGDLIGGK
ncbi:MAG: TIGR00266 family protein [Candidatus Cloacimonetes bacterium]|nr:TIGR00266 family protein [Candidatus Cloacimonadota bacterium]